MQLTKPHIKKVNGVWTVVAAKVEEPGKNYQRSLLNHLAADFVRARNGKLSPVEMMLLNTGIKPRINNRGGVIHPLTLSERHRADKTDCPRQVWMETNPKLLVDHFKDSFEHISPAEPELRKAWLEGTWKTEGAQGE